MSITSCLRKLKNVVSAEDAALVSEIYRDFRIDGIKASEAANKAIDEVMAIAVAERREIGDKIEKAGGVIPALANVSRETKGEPNVARVPPQGDVNQEPDTSEESVSAEIHRPARGAAQVAKPDKTAPVDEGATERAVAEDVVYSVRPIVQPFYSAVSKAIDESRTTKASAQQWLGELRNKPGVKPEELDWVLGDLPKGAITKAEMQDFVRANAVDVQEVVKGKFPKPEGRIEPLPNGRFLFRDRGGLQETFATLEEAQAAATQSGEVFAEDTTKFSNYQEPGGQNYRELLLTLPERGRRIVSPSRSPEGWGTTEGGTEGIEVRDDGQDFRGGHYDEPNVLAHVRFNDRVDADGRKTLFIEEIQSDWHQKGRKQGYNKKPVTDTSGWVAAPPRTDGPNPGQWTVRDAQGSEIGAVPAATEGEAIRTTATGKFGVPDAPFKKTWPDLSMKRMIKYAADNGYDSVSWTPGDIQAERYDLSKQIDELMVKRLKGGDFELSATLPGGGTRNLGTHAADKLDDVVGKDLADTLRKQKIGSGDVYDAEDLKVGGTGMKAFYDKMLVSAANKLGKRFGAKVRMAEIGTSKDVSHAIKGEKVWSLPITESMRAEATGKGFPLFAAKRAKKTGGLTPAAKAAQPLMKEAVNDIVARMAIEGTDVEFADEITATGLAAQMSGGMEGGQAAGSYSRHEGLIRISMADGFNQVNTALHESWHTVEGLMTPAEKRLIKIEMPRLKSIAANDLGLHGGDVTLGKMSDRETVAYAAAAYMERGLPGVHIGIRKFFDRLARIIRQIRNAMNGLGFRTSEDVFDIAARGEMKKRAPAESKASAVSYSALGPRSTDPNATWFPPSDVSLASKYLLRAGASRLALTMPDAGTTRRKLQDRMNDVKRMQDAIAEQHGPIPEHLDTYLAEELFYGKAGEKQEALRLDHVMPLVEDMRERNITAPELDDYLYARHAPERNAEMARRNPSIGNAGSGMSDAAAAKIMADIATGGRTAAFKAIAKRIDRITENARLQLLRGGLIDKETFDQWTNIYQHYVPLRGFEAEAEDFSLPKTGRGFDVRGKETKTALGRRSKADSPMLYTIQQAEQALIRAEKNRVANTFLRMVRSYPNAEVWNVYMGEKKRRINPQTGLVETYFVHPPFVNPDNVIAAKVGGKTTYIEINHPGVLIGMKQMGNENMGALARTMSGLTRWLSRANTGLNPEFIISNFARDLTTAGLHMSEERINGLRGKVLRDIRKAIPGVFGGLYGKKETDWQKHFHEFAEAGGKISYFDMDSIDNKRRKIELAVKNGKAYQAYSGVWDFIENANGAVENGVRLATYVHLRKEGYTKAKAASAARNLTVNFNRKGEWGATINALYLFYNASIQGSVRIVQSLHRSPTVQKAVVSFVGLGFGLNYLNYLIAGDDDDGENFYDKIPQWEKERNLIFMTPGSEGKYTKIPLPYGYNTFFVLGDQAASVARKYMKWGSGVEATDAAGNIVTALVGSFLPIGTGSTVMQFLSPTAFDPVVELAENKNWFGGPIKPQKFPTDRTPESKRYFASVNPFLRELSSGLNKLTGGNEFRSGSVDVSPASIEHFLDFFTGAAGTFWFERVIGNAASLVEGEEIPNHKIPFKRKLTGRVDDYANRNIFYEELDQARSLDFEIKGLRKAGDRDGVRAAMERDPHLTKVLPVFRAAETSLRKLRQQERAIMASKKLSSQDKRARRDRVRARQEIVMNRARKAWVAAREK